PADKPTAGEPAAHGAQENAKPKAGGNGSSAAKRKAAGEKKKRAEARRAALDEIRRTAANPTRPFAAASGGQ
ncbi:MAG: hypothetical protein WBE72_08575, partial [Terracidiphilus sp.]